MAGIPGAGTTRPDRVRAGADRCTVFLSRWKNRKARPFWPHPRLDKLLFLLKDCGQDLEFDRVHLLGQGGLDQDAEVCRDEKTGFIGRDV